MSESEKKQLLEQSEDLRVKVAIVDIDGVLRGKIIRKEKAIDALDNSSSFCDVVFGWDMNDELYDSTEKDVTGWHTGYPDTSYQLDINTLRHIPWEEDIPFLLGDFSKSEHPACGRTLLKKVIEECKDLGFEPMFSEEFEWFNFKETPESIAEKNGLPPTPMTPGMFGYSVLRASQKSPYFNDLFLLLDEFGIPLEGIHTETGPGVYEACIHYSDALEAADRAVLFKTAVKEIALQHGLMASFMAKWSSELPGCSGHIHQSLWKDKQNTFHSSTDENGMSETMKSFIAGQLLALPQLLPMYAPTINSYKRLVEGAWAPTTLTWGFDNRTTALRIINPNPKATRVELRVPGSDVNPYLAMSAALASGLYGIKNKLKLTVPPTKGNGYEDFSNGKLPADLKSATEMMKHSDLARELLGDPFVDHFTKTREWEWRKFAQQVTDWEIKRYFEII